METIRHKINPCVSTKNVFTTNNRLNGLMANRTYYIKETEAPALYPSVADKVIKLKVDAAGNTTIENSSELNGLVTLGPVQGDQKIQLKGASDHLGIKDGNRKYHEALEQMKRDIVSRGRKELERYGIIDYYHYGTGITAYKQNNFTSSTERTALRNIQFEDEMARIFLKGCRDENERKK